jgi:hypothetical protein
LLGQPEAKAAAEARRHGCAWRVINLDDKHLIITADGRPNRVDADMNHGIVTAVGVY